MNPMNPSGDRPRQFLGYILLAGSKLREPANMKPLSETAEPTGGKQKPLGGISHDADVAEALAAFSHDLDDFPENSWSLTGTAGDILRIHMAHPSAPCALQVPQVPQDSSAQVPLVTTCPSASPSATSAFLPKCPK